MKQRLMAFLAAILLVCPVPVQAANRAGQIYATDIRAYINGVEVPSYNIGGKTAVVVEDITGAYRYDNDARTLTLNNLSPDNLRPGSNASDAPVGTVEGAIYETDIRLLVYGVEVPSYNLGGKTAVALEDLGADQAFNELGGRYQWNEEDRIISLDFLYPNATLPDRPLQTEIRLADDLSKGTVSFAPGEGSAVLTVLWPEWITGKVEETKVSAVIPLTTADGTAMGYYFLHPSSDGQVEFPCFNSDALAKAADQAVPPQPQDRNTVIQTFLDSHMATVIDRMDTPEYSFLYLSGPTFHGATQYLLLVRSDGSSHLYDADLPNVSKKKKKSFRDVKLDPTAGQVTFHYDVDYCIDCTTGEMTKQTNE